MRVLLSGGGTGGHIYPALAVIDALRRGEAGQGVGSLPGEPSASPLQDTAGVETSQQGTSPIGPGPRISRVELLWVGTRDGLEAEVVPRAGVPFEAIDAAGLRGVLSLSKGGLAPPKLARNLASLIRGTRQAHRIIGHFRPDVIFVTGGYVSVPVVLAGRARRVPIVIFLPDIVPGLAIRSLARAAAWVAVSFERSRQYLPREKVVVTGYPVRAAVFFADATRTRQNLGLDQDAKTVLIFGGSRGARRINWAVTEALEALLGLAQLVHIAGRLDIAEMERRREALSATLTSRYHLFAYLHEEMIDALTAADLIVSRAGAATLGEFPAAGVAAILVPYPYAGAHQADNAAVLAEAGGAIVVPDAELTGERLLEAVREILTDEDRLATMQANMRRLAQPDAARRIAELLWEVSD